MNIENELRRFEIKDEESLTEYLNLVSRNDEGVIERHHILPKAIFPEYIRSEWNLVNLTVKNHVKAHELLFKIYGCQKTATAYYFMSGSMERHGDIWISLRESMVGEGNVSKLPEVRKKISASKTGKKREDMLGKRFFGASEETQKRIFEHSARVHRGKVCVIDSGGNMLKVSVNDERIKSGLLKVYSRDIRGDENPMKNKELVAKQLASRNEKYDKFKSMTDEEFIMFMVHSYNAGKRIFNNTKTKFLSNYSSFLNKSEKDKDFIFKSVVQRLEKDSLSLS